MTQKISQNKTYVAVNVPAETQTNNNSSKLLGIFKRNASTGAKKDKGEKTSEYARLFSLAKPEKWNLLGNENNCCVKKKQKCVFCLVFFCRGGCFVDNFQYGNNGNTVQFGEGVGYYLYE